MSSAPRGIINTDVPTLDNFLTGLVPTGRTPTRLKHDGRFDVTRRYAPDDNPGACYLLALERLPKGFGRYADGLMMIYMAERLDLTGQANGLLNAQDAEDGWWSRKFDSTVRIAVHEAAGTVEGYATGWHVLDFALELFAFGSSAGLPSLNAAVSRYASGIDIGTTTSGGRTQLPSATIGAQRLGEWVYFSLGLAGEEFAGQNSDAEYNRVRSTYRLGPDLSVQSCAAYGEAGDIFVSDSVDPVLWIDADGPLQVAGSDLAQAAIGDSTQAQATAALSLPTTSIGATKRFVFPHSAGDYGPPEIWIFKPNADLSHDIYRSTWKPGAFDRDSSIGSFDQDPQFTDAHTRYPRANEHGYAFDRDWDQPVNHVGHLPPLSGYVPIYVEGAAAADFKVMRNEQDGSLLLVAVGATAPQDDVPVGIVGKPTVAGDVAVVTTSGEGAARVKGLGGYNYLSITSDFATQPLVGQGDRPDLFEEVDWFDQRPSQIWTAVSYDDGATWTDPVQPDNRIAPRDGDDYATQWVIMGGAHSGMNRETTNAQSILSACTLTADGSLVMGLVDVFLQGGPAGRVPFWTSPPHFGSRMSLYVVGSTSRFGSGSSTPRGVLYSRARSSE